MTSQAQEIVCDGCGQDVRIMKLPILGGPNKGKIEEMRSRCLCSDKEIAEGVIKDRERKMHDRALELFDRFSLIPPELQTARFDNYTPKNKEMDFALRLCKRYVEVFKKKDPKNLFLYGSYGVGKSHLCVALQHELMKKGFTAIFVFLPDLLEMFTDTYNKKSKHTEGEIMNALKTVDVLVIDDVGAEGTLGIFGLKKISSIVNGRQGKHTIYTSNFGPDQLFDLMGERIFSRLMNLNTEPIPIDGENHRMQKFLKNQEDEPNGE